MPFGRNNPAIATIQERYPLTKKGSTKQTWHIALDMGDLDLTYEPGDSIGIYAENDPTLVEHLLEAMQAEGSEEILPKKAEAPLSLRSFLTSHANLSRITSKFLTLIDRDERLRYLLDPTKKPELRAFLSENDPLHLLREYRSGPLNLQEVCDHFGPLLPRFYSVASSKKTTPTKLDLTVALFSWMQNGEKRFGVASHFLCNLAELKTTPIPLYVQPAPHFRLPEDHSRDIIMIGPGTGVAPFRAFIQERAQSSASGNHWLFFGERNRSSDFFYEEEWKSHQNLKLDAAFSRDQKEKVYVQHKMLEEGAELYRWMQGGAHLYVCGDAKEMAKGVETVLLSIFQEHGNFSLDEAKRKLKDLRKSGHYCLDVY